MCNYRKWDDCQHAKDWSCQVRLTFSKTLTLHDEQHIFEIWRNLINKPLLVKLGYKVVLKSNRAVISKGEMFIRKDFVSEGLFKLNVLSFIINEKSSFYTQSCMMNTESYDVWHVILGHVNLKSIMKISNLNLIPKFKIDHSTKCKIYTQSK